MMPTLDGVYISNKGSRISEQAIVIQANVIHCNCIIIAHYYSEHRMLCIGAHSKVGGRGFIEEVTVNLRFQR